MLRDINNLPARFGAPDSLEPRFSQYLPVDQGKSGRRLLFAELKLDTARPSAAEFPGSREETISPLS